MREVAIVGAGMTPFGEHFALGIKDLLPMAFAECAASVDKGLDGRGHPGGVVRRAVDHGRLPLRHPRRLLRAARHPGHPRGERVRDRQRRGAQRGDRHRVGVLRRGARGGRRQGARVGVQGHVLGVDGHDPRHGLGLPARAGRPGQLRPARRPLPARVARHAGAHGDGGGEEPPPRGQQPEGAAAVRDHRRAGAQRADGGRAVRTLRLHAAERRRGGAAARRRGRGRPVHGPSGVGPRRRARPRPGHAPAQAGHDHVPGDGPRRQGRVRHGRDHPRPTSTSPRSTTASPASR